MKTNQSGFVTTWLVLMLPLLLAIVSVVSAALLLLRTDAETRHLCRTTALKSQEDVARKLDQLLKMNPQAQSLRHEREQAEQQVEEAPEAITKAIAATHLAAVIGEQIAFRSRQQTLITEAQAQSVDLPRIVRTKVLRALSNAKDRVSPIKGPIFEIPFRPAATHFQSSTPQFDLRASPAGNLTPDYNPASNFSRTQTFSSSWAVEVQTLLPSWIKNYVALNQVKDLKFRASCAATIEKERNEWVAKLKMDRL